MERLTRRRRTWCQDAATHLRSWCQRRIGAHPPIWVFSKTEDFEDRAKCRPARPRADFRHAAAVGAHGKECASPHPRASIILPLFLFVAKRSSLLQVCNPHDRNRVTVIEG